MHGPSVKVKIVHIQVEPQQFVKQWADTIGHRKQSAQTN